MLTRPSVRTRTVRAVFISDIHLGCKYAQASALLAFLNRHEPQQIYLVGDIIDGWRLRRKWHWQPLYNDILKRIWQLAGAGTTIRYTPGNHDSFLRPFLDDFGFVQIADEFVHEGADGRRRYLITHGDRFDDVELRSQWLSVIGSFGYDWLVAINGGLNSFCRQWGLSDWDLSAMVKRRVKQAVTFVSDFEQRLIQHAVGMQCDGIVCGHVHTPCLREQGGITYCNTGDWVENRSALLEYDDGTLEVVYLTEHGEEAHNPRRAPMIGFGRPLPTDAQTVLA